MDLSYKYLTHNPDDEQWGFYLMVSGSEKVEPDSEYPPKGHPNGYDFDWRRGRTLYEYQLNYITDGKGVMETRDGIYHIRAGSIILLHPNMWHSYHPVKETGWNEHYIGFRGEAVERFIESSDILRSASVLYVGYHEDLLRTFDDIFNIARSERPGYHQVCSGLVLNILGRIIAIKKGWNLSHTRMENNIRKACMHIRDNLNSNININDIADELNVNYSSFRKAFRNYTGLSPLQYHMSLRINQAEFMLINTDLSIKEIAARLGFCSVYYFSKIFKEKVNVSPGAYREGISA